MAADFANGAGSPGVAFLVSAGVIFEVISATNSSPQTAELNAEARAATLMKWVKLGLAQAVGFTLVAAAIERDAGRPAWPILLGGTVAAGGMWIQYKYALKSGLSSSAPGTENYG